MSGKGTQRTQRVTKPASQGSVIGEGGRARPTMPYKAKSGERIVHVFTGPRDNSEEVLAEYLDPHGEIRGEIVQEAPGRVTVAYPQKRFEENQKASEQLAEARVNRAAVGGGLTDTVTIGKTATLEAHIEAAEAEAAKRTPEPEEAPGFNG